MKIVLIVAIDEHYLLQRNPISFFLIMWQWQSTEHIAPGLVHRKIFFSLCAYFLLGRENFFLGQR